MAASAPMAMPPWVFMKSRPEAVLRCPALVADVIAGSFGCAEDVRCWSWEHCRVSPMILAQTTDDSYVHANRLRADRTGSFQKNLSEGQSWDAQDIRSLHRPSRVKISRRMFGTSLIGLNPGRTPVHSGPQGKSELCAQRTD